MKNVFKLSALLATLVCASVQTSELPADFVDALGELNDLSGAVVGTIGGPAIRVESIDENGCVHAVIALASLEEELKAGELLTLDGLTYVIESVKQTEDLNVVKVVLALVVFDLE